MEFTAKIHINALVYDKNDIRNYLMKIHSDNLLEPDYGWFDGWNDKDRNFMPLWRELGLLKYQKKITQNQENIVSLHAVSLLKGTTTPFEQENELIEHSITIDVVRNRS